MKFYILHFVVKGIEQKALHKQGNCSSTAAMPQP
jgi:hypothetical protein